MPFIAFLGCDGSGKSAVIEKIADKLTDVGILVTLGHWRPTAFGKPETTGKTDAADDPHGQTARGAFPSLLKLGWLWINWWGGWWRDLGALSRAGVIFFDRYHGDLAVDPKRYRYGGPAACARLASRWIPQPDLVIFLDASPEVLLSRKQEVSHEALEQARARYLEWVSRNSNCVRIDAERPLVAVVDDVLQRIENLNTKHK